MKNNSDFYNISENYKIITERIDNAMLKSGRKDKVRVMAVTKTVSPERINYAVSLGIDLLGENKAQEFVEKYHLYDKNCEIHFIGGLQNNKVKYIIDKVNLIESVNSVKLAGEINKRAAAENIIMDILLEVNIGLENAKTGANPDMLPELVSVVSELPFIRLRGLMTIPPFEAQGNSEKYFEMTQKLYSNLKNLVKTEKRNIFDILSMGMSLDYENAVKYGSNVVRIGRALFGERN